MAFIFIGAMHSYVHFTQMSGEELKLAFDAIGIVNVAGDQAAAWNLWQGLSILMGFFSIALGAVNLAALYAHPKTTFPSITICAINILMLCVVFFTGYIYLGPIQMFGAPAGWLMFGFSAFGSWRAQVK